MLEQVKEQFNKMYQTELVLPDQLNQEYEVISCIKYTEQKQVYIVREKTTGKQAVLKCGYGLYGRILAEEYRLLLQLGGKYDGGFPDIFAWTQQNGECFLVREYVEGDTLQELMEQEEPLSMQEAVHAAVQVCGLLRKLHEQNPPVIYRDVKPQNIVRTPRGEYVLIDLDTARRYKEGVGEDTMFMGTRGLASPEQFGFQQTDVRTDVYGMGMLLLYLLTGGYERNKSFDELPKRIQRIITKCTEFNPKHRYSSVKELEHSLLGIQERSNWCVAEHRKKVLHKILVTAFLCIITGGFLLCGFWLQRKKNTVEFSNPAVERAVRQMLGKTDDSTITKEDLEHIYTLIICGEKVFTSWVEHEEYLAYNWYATDAWGRPAEPFDMSDLELFTNINTLIIEFQNVTELPDLSHLPLVQVSFSNNSLTDISGLSGCIRIEKLLLHDNPISDITALQNMNELELLDLARTQVQDLSPVNSDTIKALYLDFTEVKDYGVLDRFSSIEDLRVSGAAKEEIEKLLQIENLKNLSLYESEVDSLELFRAVPGLTGLELAGCVSLTDMEGIEYLTELTFLGLAGTGIGTFPEHFYHDKLTVLEITGTGIKEFKALLRCPNLRYLYVSEEVESKASMQLEGSDIEVTGIK